MRSKMTNMLQAVLLVTGLLYAAVGLVVFISPVLFSRIFGIPVPEDWFNQVKYDTFVAPLFFMSRGFAAMIMTTGLAMVLPLFDPLRYRGLVYYTGILFPLLIGSLFLYNGVRYRHSMVIILGTVFALVLIFTAASLGMTRKQAKSGEE